MPRRRRPTFFGARIPRTEQKLRVLVEMTLTRQHDLHEGLLDFEDGERASLELSALSWVLAEVGYPPTRYEEVLDSLNGRPAQSSPRPATYFADTLSHNPTGTVSVGDVVVLVHPRFHDRLYRVTLVDPVLRGRRLSRKTGEPVERDFPIRYPVEKMESPDPAAQAPAVAVSEPVGGRLSRALEAGTLPRGPILPSSIPFDVSPFGVGDILETTVGVRLYRRMNQSPPRYQVTRLGGPTLMGRVVYGRRITRDSGVMHGPELEITWAVRKVEPTESAKSAKSAESAESATDGADPWESAGESADSGAGAE